MKVPSLNAAAEVFIRMGVAHLAALEADPETVALAGPMREATERVRQSARRRDAARERLVTERTLRDHAEREAGRLLATVDAETLGAAPTRTIPDQIERMKTVEAHLQATPGLWDALAEVQGARTRLADATRRHANAAAELAQADADLEGTKADWQKQYRASYGALLARFGERGRVESYFVRLGHDRRVAEIEDMDPLTPTPSA